MRKIWGYIVILILAACVRPVEEKVEDTLRTDSLLLDSLLADSLLAPSEDSDITYAPVATSHASQVDASNLMSEDSTSLAADSLEVDTLAGPLTFTARILRWLTTPRDSALRTYHDRYMLGRNFVVMDDSLMLRQWPMPDEVSLRKDEEVVVADRMTEQTDTTCVQWVKLATDQGQIGWVPEDELPPHLMPDDSMSRFVYFFSHSHTLFFVVVLGMFSLVGVARSIHRRGLQHLFLRRVGSAYSILMLWLLSTTALLYAILQQCFPDVWEQFYYHPSLNPLDVAPLIGLFLVLGWGILWFSMAVVDELIHLRDFRSAFFYALSLMSYGILLYVVFTFLPYYLGFVVWVVYTAWSLRGFIRHAGNKYICGHCGAKMHTKGFCPVCGMWNE